MNKAVQNYLKQVLYEEKNQNDKIVGIITNLYIFFWLKTKLFDFLYKFTMNYIFLDLK